jgi:hypothetical protein
MEGGGSMNVLTKIATALSITIVWVVSLFVVATHKEQPKAPTVTHITVKSIPTIHIADDIDWKRSQLLIGLYDVGENMLLVMSPGEFSTKSGIDVPDLKLEP